VDNLTLHQKQVLYTMLFGTFLQWIYSDVSRKWGVTWGEAYRTPEQAALNAQSGKGIANSLHTKRLAVDINFFIDGIYQTDSAAYQVLGTYWKSLNPLCRWGGDFSKPDGNHFSIEHEGVK
jgi:D-alanyl-D-alanine carboxypeptidase